jgi:pyruvate formate-lyase activating enzyme-like uncharacterized protein
MYRIDSVNEFPTDAWHGFLKYSHGWRMESSKTLCHYSCRNRRWKLSHCRSRNLHWKLSDRWRMESTAKTKSRWTHEIRRENRVIVDARKRRWKPHQYLLEIISENWVTLDLQIITENWVTTDVWNRQRHWIHDRHIKSLAKIKSWLTHGIGKNTLSLLSHKSWAKIESL